MSREVVLPGLVDLHVHPRDFAQSYKEDFETATQAAIAGGVVAIGAMPNYEPDLEVRPYNRANMLNLHARARGRIACDVGMWAAAQPHHDNVGELEHILGYSIGTKFYIEVTQGNSTKVAVNDFRPAATQIHAVAPRSVIAAHAEDETIEDTIGMIAGDLNHPLLIPHVNNRFMLDVIKKAKQKELPVFAEVCPHHLCMTEQDVEKLGWFARMKPWLSTQADQDYLWANIDVFDTIGTDHAPHTREEKAAANIANLEGEIGEGKVTSFGVPGLEAMLPLMLQAVREGKMTPEQLIQKTSVNPRRLIGLPDEPGSSVKVAMETYEFSDRDVRSKCGWSPYALLGRQVTGRVVQVDMRGTTVFRNGVYNSPLAGRVLHDATTNS